jgi:putative phage-type endonuclease
MTNTLTLPDRPTWLEARRGGIGASDAPVILGLSPWKTALALYAEKLGLEIDEPEQSEAMTWGLRLQPVIIAAYESETKRVVLPEPDFTVTRSPDHAWMLASLDAQVRKELDSPDTGVLEVKTTSAFNKEDWTEAPPLMYQVQVQHQLAVTGARWGAIVCLIGGQRLVWADVERNDAFIERLIVKEQEFWERLQAKEPPQVDDSKASKEILGRLYPREAPGLVVNLGEDGEIWDAKLENAKERIKDAEKAKLEAENHLKAALGEAETGVLPNGVTYTWKAGERKGYVVDATMVRTLRRKDTKA